MRYRLAVLVRFIIGFIVRHSGADSLEYLRKAGIAVEEFRTSEADVGLQRPESFPPLANSRNL